jgi:carbonic anhydrase
MTNIDHLLDRNRAFADTDARQDVPALPFLPRQGLYIVICIDCRVDPAQILGIELGDALVQRNVGGRLTPAVIRDIAYAAYLVQTKAPQGPWFEVAVIHHTDCGSTLLADDELRHGYAQRIGVDERTSPTRRCWTRRAPSAPTCSGSCGRRRSRRTCRSPVTSTTSRPAWLPPSSTRKPPGSRPSPGITNMEQTGRPAG